MASRDDQEQAGSSVDRLLTALLLGGAKAAAYALTAETQEGLTCLADTVLLDDGVVARMHGADRDGRRFDEVVPLWRAAERIAQGAHIDGIERPGPAILFWQAAAFVQPVVEVRVWQPGRSGIFVPGHAPQAVGLLMVAASDRRGLGGVVWAHDERGKAFLTRVTRNPLGQGRMGAAKETLREQIRPEARESAFIAAVAAALTVYLRRPDVLSGADDAPPSLMWAVVVREAGGLQRVLAAHPPVSTGRHGWKRWNRMFEAALSEVNVEASGRRSGPDLDPDDRDPENGEPRRRVVMSLDAPVGGASDPDAAEETLGDSVAGRDDLLEHVELNDLIDRLPLTQHQRQVVALYVEGLTYEDIAQRLGIRPGTVAAMLSQIRTKNIERDRFWD